MPSFHLLADTGLAGELLGALFFERFPFLDCWVVWATGVTKLPVWGPDHREIFDTLAGGRDYREIFVRGHLSGPWQNSESRSLLELRRERTEKRAFSSRSSSIAPLFWSW